jgi:hypothetical protein
VFAGAYRAAMLERGSAHAAIDGILERAPLYEAALLFRIVTRHMNRLNNSCPQELSASWQVWSSYSLCPFLRLAWIQLEIYRCLAPSQIFIERSRAEPDDISSRRC